MRVLVLHFSCFVVSVFSKKCDSWFPQRCYHCMGDTNVCCVNQEDNGPVSDKGCAMKIDGQTTTIQSVHYNPANETCAEYVCDDNIQYTNSTRWQVRRTTNSDCKTFNLSRFESYYITNSPYNVNTSSVGDCFRSCFDLPGCYTFYYNTSSMTCKRYKDCGTSCSIVESEDPDDVVYVRDCLNQCPELSSSASYVVSHACGRSYGDEAEYACAPGYISDGSGTFNTICQESGDWTTPPPSCRPYDCGIPPPPHPNCTLDASAGTEYPNYVIYSCDMGYTLTGFSNVTCQSDGTWSSGAPTCSPVDCYVPSAPTNGSVSILYGTTYTETGIYSCLPGYIISGPTTTTCQADGNWNTTTKPTECNPVDCGQPLGPPTNGEVDMHEGTTYPSTVYYSCNTGYNSSGDSTTRCEADANWSTTLFPTCTKVDCGYPPIPDTFGYVNISDDTTYQAVVTYDCIIGYTVSEPSTITCQANGQWNNQVPNCTIQDCGQPTEPKNGYVDASNGTYYLHVSTYFCEVGYILTGPNETVCLANGSWGDPVPTCHPIDCGQPPTPPLHGYVNVSGETTYPNNASYTCDIGYAISGPSQSTCQSNGNWSDSQRSCYVVDCGTPISPIAGDVYTPNGTLFGNVAIYECDRGITISGPDARLCQADGVWSGEDPSCIGCRVLDAPAFGTVVFPDGTTFQKIATYHCNTGHLLNGTSTRACTITGEWDGNAPTCDVVDCSNPDAPINGTVTTPCGTLYLKHALYNCSAELTLSGLSVRTCQADGRWTGSVPTCTPVECGQPVTPVNGQVDTPTGTLLTSKAVYSCSEGYIVIGPSIISCLANGSWSDEPPMCELFDCGPLANPTNGHILAGNGTLFGNTAIYTCNTGYAVNGSATLQCGTSGWEPNLPVCEMVGNTVPSARHLPIYILPCLCNPNKTFENMTQAEVVQLLVKDTKIQKNSTALFVSKLNSQSDSRVSSKVIGLMGSIVVGFVFGAFLVGDFFIICNHFGRVT